MGVLTAVLGLLLAAPPARADWDAGFVVPAVPRSVEVWGPGTFSVSTLSQAHLFVEGGGTLLTDGGIGAARSLDGDSAGTYLTADGCFVSVLTDGGSRVSNLPDGGTGCVASGTVLSNPATQRVWAVKHAPDGGSFAVASTVPSTSTNTVLLFSQQGVLSSGSWTSIVNRTGGQQPTGALGVSRVVDKDFAVLGLHSGTTAVLQGGSSLTPGVSLEPSLAGGRVLAIDVFPGGQPVPYVLLGTTTGLYRGLFDGNAASLVPLQIPDAGGREVSGVDLNMEAGSEHGTGFGMAILKGQDLEHFVLRAQPVRDPSQAGTLWRIPARLPLFLQSTDLDHVACYGAQTCVASAKRFPDGGTLYLYTNAHAPEFALDGSVELEEGTAAAYTLKATDGDEDPVLVSVTPESQMGPGWSMERLNPDAGPGDTVELLFTTGNVCKTQEVGSFVAAASDGWKAHDQVRPVKLVVRHTQKLPAPEVPAGPLVTVAGQDGGLRVNASTPTALCPPEGWSWQSLSPNSPLALKVDGGSALFTPPEHLCVAGGESYTYRVIASDSAGDSPPTDFSVRLEPWGRPEAPLAPPAGPVVLNAGQTYLLKPEFTHVCAAASGFPPLVTTWSLEGDGGVPAGVTFRDIANGTVTLPASTPELTVATEDCVDAQLPLSVVHRMGDNTGLEGPASKVTVSVRTQLIPFSQGQLLLQDVEKLATEVKGGVGTNLNCAERRGLSARMRLVRETGVEVARETVAVPGTWSLPLPEACAGGKFTVEGRLVDASGAEAGSDTESVEVPALPVKLDALPEGTRMVAQCGQGARTTLAQTYPADSCPLSQVTWRWKEGPRLTWDVLTGSQVELATQDTGLAELVGRTVKLEVTGQAASGEVKTEAREVPITTEPFVELLHRAEIPTASDTGLVGFSATLTNTTECGVQEVSVVEHLEGLSYVEGSARLDGAPVAAEWGNGRLTVHGLSVGPRASAQLTYVVRPGLLGERRVSGQAFLRDIPISLPEASSPEVPDSGCGCTSGTPGPLLFALAALALAVRRRRAPATGRS